MLDRLSASFSLHTRAPCRRSWMRATRAFAKCSTYEARAEHASSLHYKSRRCGQVDAQAAGSRSSSTANGSPTKPKITYRPPPTRIGKTPKPTDEHAATFEDTTSAARATDCCLAGAHTSPSVSSRNVCRSATTSRYLHATVWPTPVGLAVVRYSCNTVEHPSATTRHYTFKSSEVSPFTELSSSITDRRGATASLRRSRSLYDRDNATSKPAAPLGHNT